MQLNLTTSYAIKLIQQINEGMSEDFWNTLTLLVCHNYIVINRSSENNCFKEINMFSVTILFRIGYFNTLYIMCCY